MTDMVEQQPQQQLFLIDVLTFDGKDQYTRSTLVPLGEAWMMVVQENGAREVYPREQIIKITLKPHQLSVVQ